MLFVFFSNFSKSKNPSCRFFGTSFVARALGDATAVFRGGVAVAGRGNVGGKAVANRSGGGGAAVAGRGDQGSNAIGDRGGLGDATIVLKGGLGGAADAGIYTCI